MRRTRERGLAEILGRVGMEAHLIKLVLEPPADPTESRELRLVVPSRKFELSRLLNNGWEKRGDARTHLLVLRLFPFGDLATAWGRKNERHLSLDQLRRSQLFREARKALKHEGAPEDLIVKLRGQVGASFEELVERARYPKPLTAVPIDRPGYEEFRQVVLGELEELQQMFFKVCRRFRRAKPLREELWRRVGLRLVREIVSKARLLDEKNGAVLEPLANRAKKLLDEAARRYAGNGAAPYSSRFAWRDVDELLRDAMSALQGLEPRKSSWTTEFVQFLSELLQNGSEWEKAEALVWIWRNCRTRSELFENFLRDVDLSSSYLLGQAYRQLYREIRHFLEPAERRLFCLMYLQRLPKVGCPSPVFPFCGRSFWLDPILQGFMGDERAMGLVVLAIGLKRTSYQGEDLLAELETRFKAYLDFYTYWLGATRQEERFARKNRRQRARLRRAEKIDVETLADPRCVDARGSGAAPASLNLPLRLAGDEWLAMIEKYGIQDRRGITRMLWGEGLSQREVAARVGVTQQAVSARLRRTTKMLLKRLAHDGHVPHGAQLQKGKWAPRA